ncbi:uncharacterized protein DS421_15g510700 [Arachis hypogaea]|nr:uncharacterized protein DS421_15g510700 [Arachis hypogaea]
MIKATAKPVRRPPPFGSSVPSSFRPDCFMLRLESLRLLRKWLGAEILVVDFGLRRKEIMRRLDCGIEF